MIYNGCIDGYLRGSDNVMEKRLCTIKFSSGEEVIYRTNFDDLVEGEEVVVEIIKDNMLGLSRANFVNYLDIGDLEYDAELSVVGRWLD